MIINSVSATVRSDAAVGIMRKIPAHPRAVPSGRRRDGGSGDRRVSELAVVYFEHQIQRHLLEGENTLALVVLAEIDGILLAGERYELVAHWAKHIRADDVPSLAGVNGLQVVEVGPISPP